MKASCITCEFVHILNYADTENVFRSIQVLIFSFSARLIFCGIYTLYLFCLFVLVIKHNACDILIVLTHI